MKHALPAPDPSVPARQWCLAPEGTEQAIRLADVLTAYEPYTLLSSPEPKAASTAVLIATATGAAITVVDGLREIDRPVLPWMDVDEHKAFNRRLFDDPDNAVVGNESARDALNRFEAALTTACAATDENVVAITHGTVISLFAANHNDAANAFELWKELDCASFVVVSLPGYDEVVVNPGAS